MAAFGGGAHLTLLHRNSSRLASACPKQILVQKQNLDSPAAFSNLRLRLRARRQLKASLHEEVSVNGKEEEEAEAPANALEFTHKVSLDVLAPLDLVWAFWTDIKSAPLWMRWIDRVDFLDDDEGITDNADLPPGLSRLSRWICSTIGFEVMWVARVEHVESNRPVRVLRWATVEGLRSRGEVTFKENTSNGTTVELSISHSLPAALGRVMQSSALKGLVQATLQSDLECFQKYAAEAMNQQLDGEKDDASERKGSLTITTDCSHEATQM